MSGLLCSERALHAAESARQQDDSTAEVMAAAHDREALGLDASVCARTFLTEIVEAVVDCGDVRPRDAGAVAAWLRSEFGDQS
jgi:hypothetical protein